MTEKSRLWYGGGEEKGKKGVARDLDHVSVSGNGIDDPVMLAIIQREWHLKDGPPETARSVMLEMGSS